MESQRFGGLQPEDTYERYGPLRRGDSPGQEGESCAGFTTVHSRKDGRPIKVLVSLSTVEYAGKMAVLSFNRDVTEQEEVAEALHRRDAILEAVSFAAEKLLSGGELGREHSVRFGAVGAVHVRKPGLYL